MSLRSDVSIDYPRAFWTTANTEVPGSKIYTWKIEEWEFRTGSGLPTIRWHHIHSLVEFPKEPQHSNATAAFKQIKYPALPDEDLGFFYDPSRIQICSTLKVAIEDPKRNTWGLPAQEQVWRASNVAQAVCPACQVQQVRGLFHGFDAPVQYMDAHENALGDPFPRACGVWDCYTRLRAPNGPYIALDPCGAWKAASPVSPARYNEILVNAIKREIRRRAEGEGRERACQDARARSSATPSAPAYYHPLIGSWTSELPALGSRSLITPALWPDGKVAAQDCLPFSWLEQRQEREASRRELLCKFMS